MKKTINIIIICTLANLAVAQNMGINESNPSQKLDVGGWIEVGNESQGSAATSGTLRYHSSGKLQIHNGSAWVDMVSASTTFTRWGVNICPSTSTIVYAGYAAGAHYTHNGSGSNTLCLTNTPNWTGASFSDANQNGALIYGVEYQASGYGVATLVNRQDYDASCSVCLVEGASETLVMSGTVSCPSGWTRHYWGYIMANHYTQRTSEFVCVDNSPQFSGSNTDSNGSLWYPTETERGSLLAPYVQNREVPCAVCTQ